MGKTLYEILGVERDAPKSQIRRAYLKLIKTVHPDAGGDPEQFRAVQEAYEVLSNPERRARYDETGQHDENAIKREEGMLGNIICNAFAQAMNAAGGMIDTVNLIGAAKREMQNEIGGLKNRIRALDGEVGKIDKIMSRLKFKGKGRDFLGESFRHTREMKHAEKAQANERIDMLTKAIAYADHYTYKTDNDDDNPFFRNMPSGLTTYLR